MHTLPLEIAVRRLRAAATPPSDTLADRDLVARYIADRDEAAFATLVDRYGSQVLGVCRRVLAHRHDAEDAFQATFLVLARNASAIRESASLGCWLHGVAFRVASTLKRRNARQPRTGFVVDVVRPPKADETLWSDVRRVLDEEFVKLPERLRLPITLCYLEGKTRDEAATALGWSLSTLRGRLEDGRERLRVRLAHRGVDLTAALLAVSAAGEAVAVDHALLSATVHGVIVSAPAPIRALAETILLGGVLGKMKTVVAFLFIAVLGVGTTSLVYRAGGDEPRPSAEPAKAGPVAADKPKGKALDATIRDLARAADRIWVVDSPTADRLIPEPVEVLKGMSPPDSAYTFRFNAEALKDLPRKDHRWIVFLRSVDEVDHIPKVKPLPGDRWYIPFDEATAALLRAGVAEFAWGEELSVLRIKYGTFYHLGMAEVAWGEELSGLRLGLRVRPGDEAVVEIAMENVGKKDKTILQFRGHYFDDWELLEITATGPDGKSWRLERFGPPKKDGDAPTLRILKPGEKYIHAVRPTRWVTPPDRGGGGNAPADLFTPGKDFRISLSYKTTDGQLAPRWWIGRRLTAGPVTLTIPKAEEWGQPAGDFRARLRLPKRTYSAGEPLAFELDVRNDGKAERELTPIPYHCEVEVDGRPFGYFGEIRYKCLPKKLLPGVPLLPFLDLTTTATWTAEPMKTDTPDRQVPLVLAPGKHIVRVAFPVGGGVRVVSNSLEIEVGPDTWGLAAGGIQSRLRLDQVKFKAGEPLAFTLDLRNRGEKDFSEAPVPYSCAIEFDGETYTYSGTIGYLAQIRTIEPAGQFHGWVNVTTDKLWVYARRKMVGNQVNLETVPLTLTVGKHKVRVAYQMTAPNAMKPVSNTVEFEVEAAGLLKANKPAK